MVGSSIRKVEEHGPKGCVPEVAPANSKWGGVNSPTSSLRCVPESHSSFNSHLFKNSSLSSSPSRFTFSFFHEYFPGSLSKRNACLENKCLHGKLTSESASAEPRNKGNRCRGRGDRAEDQEGSHFQHLTETGVEGQGMQT